MALWKVIFEKSTHERKINATFFAEVEVYAMTENEAIEKALCILKKYYGVDGLKITAYRYRTTLDAWMPGKSALERQLDELRKRGIEPELTEEGKRIIRGA